jgi:hypothetical protein
MRNAVDHGTLLPAEMTGVPCPRVGTQAGAALVTNTSDWLKVAPPPMRSSPALLSAVAWLSDSRPFPFLGLRLTLDAIIC